MGIADPIAWAESVSPAIIDRWVAFAELEPFGNQWLQTARLGAAIEQLTAFVAASHGVKYEPRPEADFMPIPQKRKGKELLGDGMREIAHRMRHNPKMIEAKKIMERNRVRFDE